MSKTVMSPFTKYRTLSKHSADFNSETKVKVEEVLSFLLNSYRAMMTLQQFHQRSRNSTTAILLSNSPVPFTLHAFLNEFRRLLERPYFYHLMKVALQIIINEGLLDSLVPYLKNSWRCWLNSTVNPHTAPVHQVFPSVEIPSRFDRAKQRDSHSRENSPDILIHVCDEKGITKDFNCPKTILTKEMAYFAMVPMKGQRLQDLDISVHCEISIFDWLLDWIKTSDSLQKVSEINAGNVVGYAVSAEFLKMPLLNQICVNWIYERIENVISDSPNIGCLTDSLLSQLAPKFSNEELELKVVPVDPKDRITSRLYSHFIVFLTQSEPSASLGHYGSAASLFQCQKCTKLVTNEFAPYIPCTRIHLDATGRQYFHHIKETSWSLPNYLRELKREFGHWRAVYWRLWGLVNYFRCLSCEAYFPAALIASCRFHMDASANMNQLPEGRSYLRLLGKRGQKINDFTQITTGNPVLPYGYIHSCCNAISYNFQPIKTYTEGCQLRDHLPDYHIHCPPQKLAILNNFRELVAEKAVEFNRKKSSRVSMALAELKATEKNYNDSRDRNSFLGASTRQTKSGSITHETESFYRHLTGDFTIHLEDYGSRTKPINTYPHTDVLWCWSSEMSTRLNQDMQRESEEKYMVRMAQLLVQM